MDSIADYKVPQYEQGVHSLTQCCLQLTQLTMAKSRW